MEELKRAWPPLLIVDAIKNSPLFVIVTAVLHGMPIARPSLVPVMITKKVSSGSEMVSLRVRISTTASVAPAAKVITEAAAT